MQFTDKYVNLGEVRTRDPKSHVADPRGNIVLFSAGLTKAEYYAGIVLQAMAKSYLESTVEEAFSPQDAERSWNKIIESAKEIGIAMAKEMKE